MAWPIKQRPLPYCDRLEHRSLSAIDLVVLHCTELPDLAAAREYGEQVRYPSGSGNSGHYYIDRDGRIEQYVADDRIAHHTRGYNERSIGIELVNRGRFPNWYHSAQQEMTDPYPDAQLDATCALLITLSQRLPALVSVAGHDQLDTSTIAASDDPQIKVRRKLDPGPLFPWSELLAKLPLQRFAA